MNDFSWLLSGAPDDLFYERNFSFRCSTIGVASVCAIALFPSSVESLIWAVERLQGSKMPYKVVGKMSNVLPCFDRTDTVYIFTERLHTVTFDGDLVAEAGVTANTLLRLCKQRNLSGLEFLTGIPCSVGGATYMNAGVQGAYMDGVVKSVVVYGENEVYSLPVKECGYAYKKSRFQQSKEIILAVRFALQSASKEQIEEAILKYANRRKALPKGRSMGCVFKNPAGALAGKLVEGAGLKGLRVGGAVVSREHANFILNDGGATYADVVVLIQRVKNAVYAQYGVKLEEEIEYLP